MVISLLIMHFSGHGCLYSILYWGMCSGGTSPLKFQGGRKIGEKNKENERKIKYQNSPYAVNIWAETAEFLKG